MGQHLPSTSNNMKNKVLLVEDETTLSMIISETLTEEGYDVTVAYDGEKGLEAFLHGGADIVIADVMMPHMDGFDMARRIRAVNPDVPLIFLTARSSIDDIVEGFELGANDYLKKPFKMRELLVRIQAQLKRNLRTESENTTVTIGQYTFDTVSNRLTTGNHTVELSHIESTILTYMVANKGATIASSALMELVWKHDDYYNRNSLHGYIHKLRHHLRHDRSISIINLRGIGYRLAVTNATN